MLAVRRFTLPPTLSAVCSKPNITIFSEIENKIVYEIIDESKLGDNM